jgi:tRNA dimethylallyltransferase
MTSTPPRNRVVVIGGPTASGKSALGLALAERFQGEIVNADSRQLYRYMDIGTAKPSPAERARARHHLIDIRDPDESFSLAEFLSLAEAAILDITARGRLPVVVGGTGQYVRALTEGWQAPELPPDPALRARLLARAEEIGTVGLHAELAEHDPDSAARIDARNVRRVVRALEVLYTTGRPASAQQQRGNPPYDTLILAPALPRPELYERIDRRVDAMFDMGLVGEVESLRTRGYSCGLPSMSSIGYAQVCGFLDGVLTLSEAVERTKTATHRLARTQGAWFRAGDPAIHWLDGAAGLPVDAAVALSKQFLDQQR